MQYAFQTRDYKNDYRWSWEERGRDCPLAKISLELQRLIKDGEKGMAVLARDGQFHVIFASVNKLGTESLGQDFSGANIRINMVFSDISQEMAKGLIQYYLANRSDPGIAFADIVIWDTNSWKVNEQKVQEAFNRIQPGRITGNQLVSLQQGGKLLNWQDYDFSNSDGVKFVIQSNQLKFAVEPVPLPSSELSTQEELPPKKKKGCFLLIVGLVVIALAGGVYGLLNENMNKQYQIDCLQEVITNNTKKLAKKQSELDNETLDVLRKQELLNKTKKELVDTQEQLGQIKNKLSELDQSTLDLKSKEDELARTKEARDKIKEELESIKKQIQNEKEILARDQKAYQEFLQKIKGMDFDKPEILEYPDQRERVKLMKQRNDVPSSPKQEVSEKPHANP